MSDFFPSYLVGYLFWVTITIGSLGILMIQHLTGGNWGHGIRRLLEAAAKTLPLMFVLFIPIIIFSHNIFPWTHEEEIKTLGAKTQYYLNTTFFSIRAVIYFIIWSAIAFLLSKFSIEQDKTTTVDQAIDVAQKCRNISGPGLLISALTVTFASVDWIMSLDPHWFSTIFGILVIGGCLLSSFSFMIIMLSRISDREGAKGKITSKHFHDLGKLLLACVMLWAYFNLSQLLIMWSANLPEEIIWYIRRRSGGWQYVGPALVVLHFAVPFLILLSRALKKKPTILATIAGGLLFMHLVDLFWLVFPQFNNGIISINSIIFTLVSTGVIGAIWLGAFFKLLSGNPLIPLRDPYIQPEAVAHGKH